MIGKLQGAVTDSGFWSAFLLASEKTLDPVGGKPYIEISRRSKK